MREAPAPRSLAVVAQLGERVEPAGGVVRVPQEADTVDLPLADERLRVDHEPRLALGREDVPAVQILVDEMFCIPVHGTEHVERRVEQAAGRIPLWQLLQPAVGLVRDRPERVRLGRLQLQPRQEGAHDLDLLVGRVPKPLSRPAALDQERAPLVVPGQEPDGAAAVPERERIRLELGFEVPVGVHLQHGVARGDDE